MNEELYETVELTEENIPYIAMRQTKWTEEDLMIMLLVTKLEAREISVRFKVETVDG